VKRVTAGAAARWRRGERCLVACLVAMALATGTACTDGLTGASADAEQVLRDTPERAILVEVREEFGGDDRSWFIAVPDDAPQEPSVSVSEAGASVETALVHYDAACRAAADRVFDAIAARGFPAEWDLSAGSRKQRLIVPNHAQSLALVTSILGHGQWLADLDEPEAQRVSGTPLTEIRGRFTWSGDGTRIAFAPEPPRGEAAQPVVVYDVTRAAVVQALVVERTVKDIAWSPDGERLAVLRFTSRARGGPLETIGNTIGHGVPYCDFELVVIELASGAMQFAPIAQDVKHGDARILWDPRAVRCTVGEQ
jgi:hypothetical protein